MSIRQTIIKFYDTQSFVKLLWRRVENFNKSRTVKIKYDDLATRKLAFAWQAILESKYEFPDAEFAVLIDEVIGELVFEMVKAGESIVHPKSTKLSPDDVPEPERASLLHAPEYVAIDVAIEILKQCFGKQMPQQPTPTKILEVAIHLRKQPHDSHKYWRLLGLPNFD